MGFNKIILPEVEKLKEQLSEVGELEFTRYWKNRFYKTDATMGSVESMELIDQFIFKRIWGF